MLNKEEFDFLGITKFHESGYKGQGVVICSKENVLANTFDDVFGLEFDTNKNSKYTIHGTAVMDYIRQVAPKATKCAIETDGLIDGSKNNRFLHSEGMDYLQENTPDILTTSFFRSNDVKEPKQSLYKALYDKGCFLCCAAGNEEDEGMQELTNGDIWKAIGACIYNDGNLKAEKGYAAGEEMDFVSFHNLKTTWDNKKYKGTSFASPLFAGMLALVQCFFKEKTGRKLNHEQLIKFVKDNCIDLEEVGHDIKTGHGLFILPDPYSINIYKYSEVKMFRDYTEYEKAIDYLSDKNEMDSPDLWKKRIKEENDINLMWYCIKWANAVARNQ